MVCVCICVCLYMYLCVCILCISVDVDSKYYSCTTASVFVSVPVFVCDTQYHDGNDSIV